MIRNRKMQQIKLIFWVLSIVSFSGSVSAQDSFENPHGDIQIDCQACHSTESWQVLRQKMNFNHDQTGFALTGPHLTVECADCHSSLVFSDTGSDCFSCHTDIHQGELGNQCETCHTTSSWENRKEMFEKHNGTNFPLTGAHAISDCESCHSNEHPNKYVNLPLECEACHISEFNNSKDPDHQAAEFSINCESCHKISAVKWNDTRYVHPAVFELKGAHKSADCLDCHQAGYSGISQQCYSCHQNDYNNTSDPNHQMFGFVTECQICHDENSWDDAFFDHLQESGYELTGQHESANCISCHVNNQLELSTECYSCHEQDYVETEAPDHEAAQLSANCQECHSTAGWSPSSFDHASTGYVLSSAHASVQCASCHVNGQFAGTPTDCFSCHEQDYNQVSNPDHVANNYNLDCLVCHTENAWSPATIDHDQTAFPLTGAHIPVACADCHVNNIFTGTPTDCYSCHESDYNDADDHLADNYPLDCTICHNTTDWEDADFDHNQTAFPLTGAHISTNCGECHTGGQYSGLSSACYDCHQADYNSAEDHLSQGYPHDCTECHNTSDWEDEDFTHETTGFPLTGAHDLTSCSECHENNTFSGTPSECFACHESDFNSTINPNHVLNQFSQICETCHSTIQWVPATFDHNQTNFALSGAHLPLNCIDCHVGGQYTGTPTDCFSCHEADFNGVSDPNHVDNNFDHDCTICHSTTVWSPATFDHSQTNFPLTGAHISTNCIDCHQNGQYTGTPTDCFSCHETDFNGVSDPNHVDNNFDHDCTICHSTTAWTPATFDHSQTNFPLTGAHLPLNCIDCHVGGQYTGTPTDCFSCHEADFNGVSDPNHVDNNFDHDCTICHSTTAWSPATFDHSQTNFPLTGAHVSVSCTDCHQNGQYAGTPADCFSCHENDYISITDPDHVANNYSHDCTTCHTTNSWSPATFDHSVTAFPLTGSHISVPCTDCHVNGQFAGTPTECYPCHETDYNSAVNPAHLSQGFPLECETCHSTTIWSSSTFNHDLMYFPIYSGKHDEEWDVCADCHVDPNNFAVFECIFCHKHNKSDTDNDHQGVTGYVYQSSACLSCHPDGDDKMRKFMPRLKN